VPGARLDREAAVQDGAGRQARLVLPVEADLVDPEVLIGAGVAHEEDRLAVAGEDRGLRALGPLREARGGASGLATSAR
jgi:hypothetical protein